MPPIDIAGFERKFQNDIDPWNYRHSAFERRKREVLIKACGHDKRGRGLELGCANGETSRELARLCLHLLAVDGSPTAIAEAKRRSGTSHDVRFACAELPKQMPRGFFDLIVVSELAYYLAPHEVEKLTHRLRQALAPRGRIVVLNHLNHFRDAAQHGELAHRNLCQSLRKTLRCIVHLSYPRFAVAVFEGLRSKRPRSG